MEKQETDTYRVTSFQMSQKMHAQLRLMCVLTDKSMGEFIRLAISDKIASAKMQQPKTQ